MTNAWLPDVYQVYGDNLNQLGLDDNRTIMHEQRFMLTNNILDPKVYQVTKITDTTPQGIIKLSLKQDEFDKTRDNVDLRICDYYRDSGEIQIEQPEETFNKEIVDGIKCLNINDNDELEYIETSKGSLLRMGVFSYYEAVYPDVKDVQWIIEYQGNEEDRAYYEGLIKMENLNANTLALKPGKANSLIGKHFKLIANDSNNRYISSIDLEVIE